MIPTSGDGHPPPFASRLRSLVANTPACASLNRDRQSKLMLMPVAAVNRLAAAGVVAEMRGHTTLAVPVPIYLA